ncbi:MAG: glycosyltransferase, partial [Candidatus Latescibacterota bacterium]
MEAMAMGVPVVATAVGGVPENVQDGQTGFLVEAGDVTGLAEVVWTLLQDDEKRLRMGALAKKYAQAHFSSSRMIVDLDVIYRELLS